MIAASSARLVPRSSTLARHPSRNALTKLTIAVHRSRSTKISTTHAPLGYGQP